MTTHENKAGRRPGRPTTTTPEERRRRRNARERAKAAARREAAGLGEIPVSPFAKGFDMLEAAERRPSPDVMANTARALMAPANLPLRHELTASEMQHGEKIARVMRERGVSGLAKNSRRAMAANWRHWIAFCLEHDQPVLPACPDALMDFFGALQEAGYQRASLDQLIYTIRYMTKVYGCVDGTKDVTFSIFWKDMCREKLRARQGQATGVVMEGLDLMLSIADPDDPLSCRDAAMLSLSYDGLLRPSELVALPWSAVDVEAKSGAVLLIAQSKTDQEGEGHQVFLSPTTIALLDMWKRHADPRCPAIFHAVRRVGPDANAPAKPLTSRTVERCFKRLAVKAGCDIIDYSGHSCRVGASQDMMIMGMSMVEIMHIGRWKTPTMPARYARRVDAVAVGQRRFALVEKRRNALKTSSLDR